MAFETERLSMRGYAMHDVEDAFAVHGDAEVMTYLAGTPAIENLNAQRTWLITMARFW